MIYTVKEDTRKKRQNGLKGIIQELIKEYDIDLSKYDDPNDNKIHNLITALQNGSDISFKNFCLLLEILGLNVCIEVKGDPDKYPNKRSETYNFSVVSLVKDKIISLDINEDDDILVKFIKKNINDKMLTARYFEGKMSEMEFKNFMAVLQKGTMSTKVFDRFCKILNIDPAVIDTKHTDAIVGYNYMNSYSRGLYCEDFQD